MPGINAPHEMGGVGGCQPIVSGGRAGRPAVDHGGGMPRLHLALEWFWDVASESSVATAPLALAVQGNHEHRDVIVGHLPFLCETVVLSLCAMYQHLGQLREPVGTNCRCTSGPKQRSKASPQRTCCTGLDRHMGTQTMRSSCGARQATSMEGPQVGPWRFLVSGISEPRDFGDPPSPRRSLRQSRS